MRLKCDAGKKWSSKMSFRFHRLGGTGNWAVRLALLLGKVNDVPNSVRMFYEYECMAYQELLNLVSVL